MKKATRTQLALCLVISLISFSRQNARTQQFIKNLLPSQKRSTRAPARELLK